MMKMMMIYEIFWLIIRITFYIKIYALKKPGKLKKKILRDAHEKGGLGSYIVSTIVLKTTRK